MIDSTSHIVEATRRLMENDDDFTRIRSGQFCIELRNGDFYRARLIGEDSLGNRTAVVVLQSGEPRVMQFFSNEVADVEVLNADDASRFDRVLCGVV